MTLLLGALTVGLILALVALGVLISFRIFRFPDITAEGSVTLGAAVAAALLLRGANPLVAVAAAGLAGALAGAVTGVLHTRCGINNLLAGILVMTALYSVNLHVLGRSNVALLRVTTLTTWSEGVAQAWLVGGGGAGGIDLLGWEVAARDLGALLFAGLIAAATAGALYLFFRTDLGTAMRATGDNPQMIRAQGGNAENLIVLGLALSNGLIATAGALLAQQQGFADVQMGIGMLVWGLASVIIGEALVGSRRLGLTLAGAVMGSVLFRLLVAIALRWGMDPNDLKLVTAGFVFVALVLPGAVAKLRRRRAAPGGSHA